MTTGADPQPAPDPAAPERPATWGFGDVAVALVGAIVVGNLLAVLLITAKGSSLEPWAALLVLVGPWALLGGWPLYATRVKGRGPVRDLALRLTVRDAVVGFLGGVAALLCAAVVAQVQVAITGHQLDARAADVAHEYVASAQAALVLFVLATAFGAPVVEELAFRGLTFGSFRKRGVGPALSVLWTTLLFAGFHFEPARLLVLAVIGGWIGVVRAATGSTTASMVAHMTVNVPGALAILLAH